MTLGDMSVIGALPPKLLKACAVIADTLHPAFARVPNMEHADKSKESCVLSSLAARDFLRGIGFVNAQVRPVVLVIAAWQDGTILHSVGMGAPDQPKRDRYWVGHMVAWVPGSRVLIDTTLYPAQRPAWPDLPCMLAAACERDVGEIGPYYGLRTFAAFGRIDDARPGYECQLLYLDDPANVSWRKGPDARDRGRRLPVVDAMLRRFA